MQAWPWKTEGATLQSPKLRAVLQLWLKVEALFALSPSERSGLRLGHEHALTP